MSEEIVEERLGSVEDVPPGAAVQIVESAPIEISEIDGDILEPDGRLKELWQ